MRWPHPQHPDHFSFMSASCSTVCKRTNQPLPFQHRGTRLYFSGTTGASNPGRGYPHLAPGTVCGSVLSPPKEAHLGDRVEMASFNTHHHRPLRRVYDFRPKTTRNIPRCVLQVLPKCEASISGQEAFPSVTKGFTTNYFTLHFLSF